MINYEVNIGKVGTRTRRAFDNGKKVVIHSGGTGSGKTYDIMIYLIFVVMGKMKNQIITIVSESHPHLKIGAMRYLLELTKKVGIYEDSRWNKSESVFTFEQTGSIIEFFSADRIGKALGARRDWLFGNEINSLKLEVWEELARRSKNIIADFNPTSKFWLEDWVLNYDDVEIVKSNYLWNNHLSKTEKARIEKRAARDANFRRIHINCEYGQYEGLIFKEIELVDEMPTSDMYGLDFGYTNDPSALIKVLVTGESIYLDEIIYSTGLRNIDISRLMGEAGLTKNDIIFADGAEPKSVDDLYYYGWNVHGVKKKGEIIYGIDLMKQYKIKITKRSVNLIKEFRNYAYDTDKNGLQLNKPIDAWNHGIDAVRYAVVSYQAQKLEYVDIDYNTESLIL